MSPELALQKALLAHLRSDPALSALVGARVYDAAPEERLFPHVVLGRAQTRPWGGLDGEGLEHALTLTCVSQFDGAEEAKAVVAAIRARLHGAELALDGCRLVNLRVTYSDVFRSPDWRPVHGVIRVRAVTEAN